MFNNILPRSWCHWGDWSQCQDDSCSIDANSSKNIQKVKLRPISCIDYTTTPEGVNFFKVLQDGSRKRFLPRRRRYHSCQCTTWNIFEKWFARGCIDAERSFECEICDVNKYMETYNNTQERLCSDILVQENSNKFNRVTIASLAVVTFLAVISLLLYKLGRKRSRVLIVCRSTYVSIPSLSNLPPYTSPLPPSYNEVESYLPRETLTTPSSNLLKYFTTIIDETPSPNQCSPPAKYQDSINTSSLLFERNEDTSDTPKGKNSDKNQT